MKSVEHGTTRCPKCMALTGYEFFDLGSTLRYEVRCTVCANVYTELTEILGVTEVFGVTEVSEVSEVAAVPAA